MVSREKELHREGLAFSFSHDHEAVRIYAHYAMNDGNRTSFYRYQIHKSDVIALDGIERWNGLCTSSPEPFTTSLFQSTWTGSAVP